VAIKKATTTEDFTEAVTDEVAVSASGYTELVGPGGQVSTVPDSILQALLDSGYTKK